MVLKLPVNRLTWQPCWRIVSSLFPPRGLFDRVTHREDLETVMAIESLTNDRLRQEAGDISLVPQDECVFGPGTTPIMSAFTHPNPQGSRFADSSYGVYYASLSIDTAVAETAFHKERFLRATHEAPIEVDMRSYASNIDANLHDLRGQQTTAPDIYDPDPAHYGAAQALARSLRNDGSNGLVYDSVRDPGGECAAIFRPNLLSPVVQGKHFCYVWDGSGITDIYIKAEYHKS
jgi:RES domain-containing protein